ncbi:DNA mismatch repair protein MutS [Candidatus Odyssella thessalonicensis]|uniref:DNA mismatch repair protein MutS n=1 Tax=Candidatus Odyssella thessalonicensis TaxID=84647 RepID=UPI000225AF1B|nr:DNA mismatch repair protein MutS [Candidatus Odyssella thessalonicensis]
MTQLNLGFAEAPTPDLSPLEQPQPSGAKLSPVMTQYLEMKKEYGDALLFFRLGDFYELFFEDAVTAAKALDIVLTKRGKNEEQPIPMCGVPVHAYESYLARLIQKGFKVAICEQLEDPSEAKKRGAKGPLKRDVVRVVTPGTITEESMLEARQSNFLMAVSPLTSQQLGIACIDLSTGAFLVEATDMANLPGVLARLNPAEIIMPDRLIMEPSLYEALNQWKRKLSPLPLARFDYENGKLRLETAYQVKTLDAFGNFCPAEIRAAGTLIDYIQVTQKAALRLIDRPRQIKPQSIMTIDTPTRRSLELHLTQSGQRQGSLMDTIDRTVTSAGSRLLSLQLAAPLLQLDMIQERQDNVSYFVDHPDVRQYLRGTLKQAPDMERALSRLNMMRGSPRDLASLRDGLSVAMGIKQHFSEPAALPSGLSKHLQRLGYHADLIDKLTRALAEELPFYTREGNFIAEGYHGELDTYRYLRDNAKGHIEQLQADYITRTGINSLKIKHNNIIGYHIDITPSHASKVPEDFIHRQTLASSIRYSTPELAELERKITVAAQQVLELETQIFNDLVNDVQLVTDDILRCCRALAALDVAAALAELAYSQGYCRPIVDNSLTFKIAGGFHPVIACLLKERGENTFVSNGCHMDNETKMFLITGPNMAGKSTYLRQNALIAILAQIGSYVPAESAHIGIVDRIFSRVGASDDLASGRSTFMVEMVETAAILHQATERSFVILDEIGRGTATFDGLSIAWAVTEYICDQNKCRTLFATHYHELTQLQEKIPTLKCLTMRIKEWEGKVIFMHEVIEGAADKSYGIHVAALAGLPAPVIQRATAILHSLESDRAELTIPEPTAAIVPVISPVERELLTLDVDSLSPREALDCLYQLKRKVA